MKTLTEIGITQNTDKATYHHFTEIYEKYFSPIRNEQLNIFEIGIFNGGSLRMLKEYFNYSQIYAIDLENARCFQEPRIKTVCGNQTDREFMSNVYSGVEFDIIIDDGGHTMEQQQISLECMLPRLKSKGIYIVEDLHTSYEYGYGNPNDSTTLFLLENIKKDFVKTTHHIKNLQSLQNSMHTCQCYYTNNRTSVTSIIIKK
jgi:hypothetical protein